MLDTFTSIIIISDQNNQQRTNFTIMTVFTNEITTSSGNANKSEDSDEPSVLLSATQAQAQTMQQETATDKSTAPEPPQWRFVSKAKSTEGYHSKFAGSYVRGEHCYHAVPIV